MTEPHDPTTDDDYLISEAFVDDFAIPPEDNPDSIDDLKDDDPAGDSNITQTLNKYIDDAIAEHNSLDYIDLTEAAKMTPTQQIAVHKLVVKHLRNIQNVVNGKKEEKIV